MSDAASLPARVAASSSSGRVHLAATLPDGADVEAYYREIAPFYDAELRDRGDLPFWRDLAAETPGARMLELGAGSGAVTAELAPSARLVVGVDLSDDLLRQGRRRLVFWPHVRLIRADMRVLPFNPTQQTFDLIVAANDPLSHLTEGSDRDTVLEAAVRLLAPGGRFVLDALWLPPSDALAVRRPGGRVQRRTSAIHGQPLHIFERWRRDPDHQRRCEARYEYRRAGHAPVIASFEARDWTPDELSSRLARAGLTITDWWGGYQREPWNQRTSEQLIVVARHAP